MTSDKRSAILSLSMALILACGSGASAQQTEPSGAPPDETPAATGFIKEPQIVTVLMNASDRPLLTGRDRGDGMYFELGNMITGAGWVSAGPGYRRHVLNGHGVLDVSAAVSSNLYEVAQARIEVPGLAHDRLALGAQAMYQDLLEVEFFGVGDASLRSNKSAYRLNNIDVLGYATIRAAKWLSVDGRLGRIGRADLSAANSSDETLPNTIDAFSDSTAPGLHVPPSFVHGDVSIAADSRDHTGHPTRGGLYRASAAAYWDLAEGVGSVRRYEIEASQFVPVFTPNWILAAHGWEVFSATSTGQLVPFYLMPSLGGQNTLRGYDDYRFHDNNTQSFNFESRWALFAHLDAAVFIDAGKVGARPGDLDFSHLRTSYGAGLRVHNGTSMLGRFDVGRSAEGWGVFFTVSDPFERSGPSSGRSSVVPFVP
jgi:hypothetical protein